MDAITAIARAVLYEGYILWPYRRSALKNQQRWTFGGVFPEEWSGASGTNDPGSRTATVLVQGDRHTKIDVRVRFLQVVERNVSVVTCLGVEGVDELTVDGERYMSWEEAFEREVIMQPTLIGNLATPRSTNVEIPAATRVEPLIERDGRVAGFITRRWRELTCALHVSAIRVEDGLYSLSVHVANTTAFTGSARSEALHHTLVSMHAVLHADRGEFISVQSPPEQFRSRIDGFTAQGLWPVLVGDAGVRDTMLAAPIILSDYPAVAPESPGDLFDGGEIDQLLILNVMALTEDEQREMRDSDPHAREILDRCRALSPDQLMRLHGVVRDTSASPMA